MILHYLSYLARHKWYVFMECLRLGIPFRGIVHDWSKFLPDEFFAYYRHFYGENKAENGMENETFKNGYYKPDETDIDFDFAWLKHQKRSAHHWQWWILKEDEGSTKVMEMPLAVRKEMLADWIGAGKAQGTSNTKAWYIANKHKIILGPETRAWIEKELNINGGCDVDQSCRICEKGRENSGEVLEH